MKWKDKTSDEFVSRGRQYLLNLQCDRRGNIMLSEIRVREPDVERIWRESVEERI
jgi:hypothetical protein